MTGLCFKIRISICLCCGIGNVHIRVEVGYARTADSHVVGKSYVLLCTYVILQTS